MSAAEVAQIINSINATVNNSTNAILAREAQVATYIAAVINETYVNTINQQRASEARIISTIQASIQNASVINASIANQIQSQIISVIQSSTQALQNNFQAITQNLANNIFSRLEQQLSFEREQYNRIGDIIKSSLERIISINANQQEELIRKIEDLLRNSDSPIIDGIAWDNGLISGNDLFSNNLIESLFAGLLGNAGITGIGYEGGTIDIGGAFTQHIENIRKIIADMTAGKYKNFSDFQKALDNLGIDTGFISSILQLFIFVPTVLQLGNALAKPFFTRLELLGLKEFNLNKLTTDQILTLERLQNITYTEAKEALDDLGYNNQDAGKLLTLTDYVGSPEMWLKALKKGIITETIYNGYMTKLGFNNFTESVFRRANEVIPNPQDLVRFGVRDVYNSEKVRTYGLDKEFPQDIMPDARALNMSYESIAKYWSAHWELPSATMGFEMYHRRIISRPELQELLKSLDVMPFWRDKLINLSYNPVTRVDVRRLYSMGIWTRQQVYNAYLDIGYNPVNAEALTEFTIRQDDDSSETNKDKLKKLTVATIQKAYRRGIIDRNKAYNELIELKYSPEDANLFLNLTDYDKFIDANPDREIEHNERLAKQAKNAYSRKAISRDDFIEYLIGAGYTQDNANKEAAFIELEYSVNFKSVIINEAKKARLEGIYTEQELLSLLTQFEFTPNEIAQIESEIAVLVHFRDKKPTLAQFIKLYKDDFITSDDLTEELSNMGYADKYLPHMLYIAGVKVD